MLSSKPPISFGFKEVLESFLPSLIAVCLFLPYFDVSFSFPSALISATLMGLVVSPSITSVAFYTARFLIFPLFFPLTRKSWKSLHDERDRCQSRWNYDTLHYSLGSDHLNLIEISNAYIKFYISLGFYFFIYSSVQIIYLVMGFGEVIQRSDLLSPNDVFLTIHQLQTPLFGSWSLPTDTILAVSLVITWIVVMQAQDEYETLFGNGEHYDQYAKSYHRSQGYLAKEIWGSITLGGEPLESAKVILHELGNTNPDKPSLEDFSRSDGYFKFPNPLLGGDEDESKELQVTVISSYRDGESRRLYEDKITIDSKKVPELNINLKKPFSRKEDRG